MKIEFKNNPTKDEIDVIYNGLVAYNELHLEGIDETNFGLFVNDDNDNILGGITGQIFSECLFIRFFWLPENIRGTGVGRKLIQTIEAQARERGIKNLYLDTYTFQAPAFYEAAGFKEVGRYTDFPKQGADKVFYQKALI